MKGDDDLSGCRALVMEDEAMPAMLLEDLLVELGCHIVASVARLDDAARACETENFDVALLDINLRGERSFAIAQRLLARAQPFVIITGYAENVLPEALRDVPLLRKPYRKGDLETALRYALHR